MWRNLSACSVEPPLDTTRRVAHAFPKASQSLAKLFSRKCTQMDADKALAFDPHLSAFICVHLRLKISGNLQLLAQRLMT
jgi:hypothetical protein